METQTVDVKQSIVKLLDSPKDSLVVEGDADGSWVMIEQVAYYRRHAKGYTDIMVKFFDDNMPVVLIPTKSKLGSGSTACMHFVQKGEFLKGWKTICPQAVAYTNENLDDFIHRLIELIGNPNLCAATNCDKRSCPVDNSATLFTNERNNKVEPKTEAQIDAKIIDRKKSIEHLLEAVKHDEFMFEGDAEGRWFLIPQVIFRRGDTKGKTDIIVKFLEDNTPIILVSDKIRYCSGNYICEHFYQQPTYIKGWRALCPCIGANVGNDMIELVQRISGLVGNPWYCGIANCDKRFCRG